MFKTRLPSLACVSLLTRKKLLAALCLTVGFLTIQAHAQTPAPIDLATLVKAAQAEGEFTFYAAATENVVTRAVKEFAAKYGIKGQFVRLSGAPLLQRYGTEAEGGNIVADLLISSSDVRKFMETAIPKGWVQSLADARLPAMSEFPKEFNYGQTAIVQMQLWELAYNTDRVKGADVPKDWKDITNPKFKDAFILPDPAAGTTYLELWSMLLQKYGPGFLEQVAALNPRRFPTGVPASQSLGAGEGSIQVPVTAPQIKALQDKGAPLQVVKPSFTTGIEMFIMLTAPQKSKSPNAARLFANWLLSPEGNKVYNADPGTVSVYDKSALPAEYITPDPKASEKKDQIRKLLGF